jgi:hypothetical protein
MREAAAIKEIIMEEKIRITETEEIIEADIPDAKEKMSVIGKSRNKVLQFFESLFFKTLKKY